MDEITEGPLPGDESLGVHFYMEAVKDTAATAEQGRPVFRDIEYVRIQAPGNVKDIAQRPVRESDKVRWPKLYEAFRRGDTQAQGTPLRDVAAALRLSPSQAEELRYFGVHTLEQLAGTTDANLGRIGPYRPQRDKARELVKAALADAPVSELRSRAAEQAAELAELRAEVERLRGKGK